MRTFTQTLKFFFLACALMCAVDALGNTVTFNATSSSFSGSAPYKITQDHVDFYLNVPNWYNNGNGHFYIWTSNSGATITWTPATGYSIAVTGVSLNGKNASEEHWTGPFSRKTYTGSSYIRSHTSSDNTEVKISQNTSTATYSYTTANNTNVFPSGNALGNNAYFKLRAEKGNNTANQDNSYEYQINWATLTYTVSANNYTVTLNNQSATTAGTGSINVTFDSNTNLTGTPAITVPAKIDYTFDGYWTAVNGGGVQVIAANGNVNANVTGYTDAGKNWKYAGNVTLYAKWILTRKTITLDNQSATTAGTPSITAYYKQNTNLTGTPAITVPGKTNCTFEGYYTGTAGSGLQVIAANGNVNANIVGYTDSDKNWIYDGNVTLYAYWKQNQTITWDLEEGVEYATGTLMDATASSGLTPVTYTSNHPEWGYVNENGRLVVVVPNKTITITASQTGDDYYNPAPNVTKTFITLGANPNQTTAVTADSITYGQTLSASTLSGDVKLDGVVISGTLSWVDPAVIPNAGTANHMVLFTPDNTDAYSPIYFEVPVTVAKADPDITWNITSILRGGVRYDHFVESSNKEKEFTVTSTSSKLTISGTTLRTENVDTKQINLPLTFTQAASPNYNAKDTTILVNIYPRAGICLPFDPMTESDYNQAKIAQTGMAEWCSTNNPGSRNNYIAWFDVEYTQRQGIALGSWEAGLEGISIGSLITLIGTGRFDYSAKSVDLFFSGIPDTISFDVESQVVTSSPPDHAWNATQQHWYLYVSEDGDDFGDPVMSWDGDRNDVSYTFTNDNIRFVQIEYRGNFTGFVKNLRITQKKSLTADKAELTFGTEAHPLQEPQAITLSYSSLGVCGGMEDAITVTSSNPAFYVDEPTITENVGIEQKGSYTIRVRCNDVNQTGKLTFTSNDGTVLEVPVSSTKPAITTAATAIFQTGTEHATGAEPYRAQRTLITSNILSGLFNSSTPIFDTLYIYGVSESAASSREWEYSPAKGYKVPVVTSSNVHTPCFVYKKDGTQYTYVRTYDASTKTLNIADSKKCGFVGYRAEAPAANAIQVSGANAELYLNNTEIIASGAPLAVNATSKVYANGANILSSTSNAAVKLSGATTLSIEDTWTGAATSAILALRPAVDYPSIDLGSANGRVEINGTQLELHNADKMAIAHMSGITELFDGEVQINDGSIGGEDFLGMPKYTFIDGGTFNDGTVAAYTLKGKPKRPRNSRGEIVSRQTMTKTALEAYDWYGQSHLTLDGSAKVNPMLMDEEVWIFNGTNSDHSDDATSWNKGSVPGETADVLINAPMVVSGGELKVKSLTINWEDKGKGIPAVTVNPNGGLTVGEGGIDAIKLANPAENLVLKAGETGETKGQTGFLRIHPESAEPTPKATVQLYSIGYYDKSSADTDENNVAAWQYVGTPIDFKGALAKTVFTRSWIYSYDESSDSWVNNRKNLVMQPFVGYATTQYDSEAGKLLEYKGELIPNTGTHTINLEYSASNGYNVVANSFAAPIDITKMRNTDFVNVDDPTIYLFHTGTHKQAEDNLGTEGSSAGQFISIAIGTAGEMATLFADDDIPTTIAPMQGFGIYASGAGGQVNLDYTKLVWNANYAEHPNKPLRAPQLHEETDAIEEVEITGALRMTISADGRSDKCYLLESESYDTLYEAGYDASKKMSGRLNIFTVAEDKQLAINATNSIEGTRVGVRTGEETTYTFRFSHIQSDKDLVLWDKETKMKVFIDEDIEYTFYAVPNSEITERFQIVAANIPTITTGVDEIESETHIQKFIKDNQLYILKDGVLYNATGAVVRK